MDTRDGGRRAGLSGLGDALERVVFDDRYRWFVRALFAVVALLGAIHLIRFVAADALVLSPAGARALELATGVALAAFVLAGALQLLLFARAVRRRESMVATSAAAVERSAADVERSAADVASATEDLDEAIAEPERIENEQERIESEVDEIESTVERAEEQAAGAKETAERVKDDLQPLDERKAAGRRTRGGEDGEDGDDSDENGDGGDENGEGVGENGVRD